CEPEWVRRAAKNGRLPSYVEGGWPFARGTLWDVHEITVSVAGIEVPVQAKPLGFWPEGSVEHPASRVARIPQKNMEREFISVQ
ncbi:MAG: hypothetical protein WCR20_11225, partial [Verrucomicrobiota bacterium]